MHDKFKKRNDSSPGVSPRVRRQIAAEAARRLYDELDPAIDWDSVRDFGEAVYYGAKRKAVAVLGRRVKPGDLPTDGEVRQELLALFQAKARRPGDKNEKRPEPAGRLLDIADHLDRFTIYRLRLEPLEAIKQNPKYHPEGDALYHSLQVFQLALDVRPHDEEFLTAALLHDVGKAIDHADHAQAGADSLAGTITPRTDWLIRKHMDALLYHQKKLEPAKRKQIEDSEHFDDLMLLREIDEAGRTAGVETPTLDQAIDYLKNLENEYDAIERDEGEDGSTRTERIERTDTEVRGGER